MTLDQYKQHFKKSEKALLDDFFTFLRFPSISADPNKRPELRACASWLEKKMKENGFQVQVWNKDDAPILLAENLEAGPGKPTLLIYNHYDVQPVDPNELWEHDPFEPKIVDDKNGSTITARGAQDNKGQ